jgi:hypothetical protein
MIPVGFRVGFDPVDQLRAQDAAAREFAVRAGQFLKQAFPSVGECYINRLEDAWVGWQCCGIEEQIKGIEASRASMTYNPRSDEEYLMKLIDERDKQQANIEQAEQAVTAMAEEQGPAIAGMMSAGVVGPLRRLLEQTEDQISNLQRSIEQRAHAVDHQPVEASEESATLSGAD